VTRAGESGPTSRGGCARQAGERSERRRLGARDDSTSRGGHTVEGHGGTEARWKAMKADAL
jgi:hypothetical protein